MRKLFKKFCGKVLGSIGAILVLCSCIFLGQSPIGLLFVGLAVLLIVFGFICDVYVFKNIKLHND